MMEHGEGPPVGCSTKKRKEKGNQTSRPLSDKSPTRRDPNCRLTPAGCENRQPKAIAAPHTHTHTHSHTHPPHAFPPTSSSSFSPPPPLHTLLNFISCRSPPLVSLLGSSGCCFTSTSSCSAVSPLPSKLLLHLPTSSRRPTPHALKIKECERRKSRRSSRGDEKPDTPKTNSCPVDCGNRNIPYHQRYPLY